MRRWLAAAALIVLGLLGENPTLEARQVSDLPVIPDPSECGIAPRSADELSAFLDATPAAAGTITEMAATPITRASGTAADPATTAFVVATIREAIACGNAAGFPGAASLVSNQALARLVATRDDGGLSLLTFPIGLDGPIPNQDQRRVLLEIGDVVILPDGRVEALVMVTSSEVSSSDFVGKVVVAENIEGTGGSEQYFFLIDDVEETTTEGKIGRFPLPSASPVP